MKENNEEIIGIYNIYAYKYTYICTLISSLDS